MHHPDNSQPANCKFGPLTLWAGLAFVVLAALSAYGRHRGLSPDWYEGFHHPLEGWDHLLTMITVGIWAAQLRGHAVWLLPLAFVGVMSAGGLAGAAGLSIPSVEGLIVISCAVFSLLIVCRKRFSTYVNVMIVAFFAFFHGFAHGQEISASASLISYTLGFVLATLLLHGAGIIAAKLLVLCAACLVAIFVSGLANAKPTGFPLSETGKFEHLDYALFAAHSLSNYSDAIYDNTGTLSHPEPDGILHKITSGGGSSTHLTQIDELTSYLPSCSIGTISGLETDVHNLLKVAKMPVFGEDDHIFSMLNIYVDTNSPNAIRVVFKHYFPDINHSPGKALLSGGTGLTSPPAFEAYFVQPRFHPLTPFLTIAPIEDNSLQLNSTGNASGAKYLENPLRPLTALKIVRQSGVAKTFRNLVFTRTKTRLSTVLAPSNPDSFPGDAVYYPHLRTKEVLNRPQQPKQPYDMLSFHFFLTPPIII